MFKLTDQFVESYKDRQPDFGPLGEVTYRRTYSRLKEDGKQEEFYETCQRVVEGVYRIQEKHCKQSRLPWSNKKAQESAQEMYERMFSMKFLPPGRGLWAMGTELIEKRGSAALQNCAFVSTKDLATSFSDPFVWMMNFSMHGCGVGFDTLGTGTVNIVAPTYSDEVHVTDDSREGWCEAFKILLDAYVGIGSIPFYNHSQLRPLGAELKTFGGVSGGPQPLIDLLRNTVELLGKRIGQSIEVGDIVDLFNYVGCAVVAGGNRRSSQLSLGDPESFAYLSLKNPDKYPEELKSHRWASNNSITATVGMDYDRAADLTAMNGEPGYVWLDNARTNGRMGETDERDLLIVGTNPCSEMFLHHKELCNLVESFPSRHETLDDFKRTLKFAYLYAKSVTLIPTHDEDTNSVMMKNRRIGMSMSGIVQAIQKHGRREFFTWCDEGYKYLRSLDDLYSNWLGIPRSVRVSTVKPSGTVSLLPGVTPGIHFPHSEFYYRTIRFASTSPLLSKLEEAGYRIEKDVYSDNTFVVYFPVKEEHFDRSKTDVSMWEQLELAAAMQKYWSDNAVSVTVTVKEEEKTDIKYALELYETRLKAVSFLPLTNHGYVQAPYQEITWGEYARYTSKLRPINWGYEGTHEVTDEFCTTDTCEIKADSPLAKLQEALVTS